MVINMLGDYIIKKTEELGVEPKDGSNNSLYEIFWKVFYSYGPNYKTDQEIARIRNDCHDFHNKDKETIEAIQNVKKCLYDRWRIRQRDIKSIYDQRFFGKKGGKPFYNFLNLLVEIPYDKKTKSKFLIEYLNDKADYKINSDNSLFLGGEKISLKKLSEMTKVPQKTWKTWISGIREKGFYSHSNLEKAMEIFLEKQDEKNAKLLEEDLFNS